MRVGYNYVIVVPLKNALVWMLGEGKEKSRGVAVVDLLRPDGFLLFQWIAPK